MSLSLFDSQTLTDAQAVGASDFIPRHQLLDSHSVSLSNSTQRVALLHTVVDGRRLGHLLRHGTRVEILLEIQRILGND